MKRSGKPWKVRGTYMQAGLVAKVENGFLTISGLQDFNGALIVLCGE
jgi:hypothetical protein